MDKSPNKIHNPLRLFYHKHKVPIDKVISYTKKKLYFFCGILICIIIFYLFGFYLIIWLSLVQNVSNKAVLFFLYTAALFILFLYILFTSIKWAINSILEINDYTQEDKLVPLNNLSTFFQLLSTAVFSFVIGIASPLFDLFGITNMTIRFMNILLLSFLGSSLYCSKIAVEHIIKDIELSLRSKN